jgi:hypothetical protein
VRSRAELAAGMRAVRPAQVRDAFARLLETRASVAMTGRLRAGLNDRVLELMAAPPA